MFKIKKRYSLKILLLIVIFLLSVGFRCKCVSSGVREQLKPITLKYWGVWDNNEDIAGLIESYQKIHPNIKIVYRKFRYEEYEDMLLNAWAEGRGPDIFSLHNTWVSGYQNKIAYMPSEIEMPYIRYESPLPGCKKKTEEVIELKKRTTLSLRDLKDKYAQVVYYDVVLRDKEGKNHIYALPLYLDTLALFYNRDLLDSANIPFPPADWNEFIEDVRLLTQYDSDGNIIQSGAALGTYRNIERSLDIISLLFLQNGVNLDNLSSKTDLPRTLEALEFYLDFASPEKEIYTWNNEMPNSLDAFAEGKLAFFFGYSYHIPIIKTKSPGLNFVVSPVPQVNLSYPINYANYWVQSVFKRSPHTKEAWDFILFMSEEKNARKYLQNTKKPAVLRSLIKEQINDPKFGAFASQALTAEGWHGYKKFNFIEESFQEVFEEIYKEDKEMTLEDLVKKLGFYVHQAK